MSKVYFKDSEGNNICGIFSKYSEGSKNCIILCHGFTTSKDSQTNIILEKRFNEIGISTLRFDFFGHGESEGNFENITVSKAIDDILSAIEYLKKIGIEKIGLVGSSFGGLASTLATSRSEDIKVLILKSPVSDYVEVEKLRRSEEDLKVWSSKGYVIHKNSQGEEKRLNYSFFEDIKKNVGYDEANKINVPVLIIHGDEDKTVPISQSMKISKIMKNCQLKMIKGADHKYSEKHEFDEMIDEILLFVKEYFFK